MMKRGEKMYKKDYISEWTEINEKESIEMSVEFMKTFSDLDDIPNLYYQILYKFHKNIQLQHWNKDIYNFSKEKILEIEKIIGKDRMESLVYENLNLIINIYESLLDIEQQIILMERFNGNEKLKVKMFSKDIFNELVNNAFTNALKLFIEFQSVVENKNLRQKTLTPMIECLASPKRGYIKITELVDSNVRNSISHGGVKVDDKNINFSYRDKKLSKDVTMKIPIFNFKTLILQLIDGVGGIFLAWIELVIRTIPSYNYLRSNLINQKDVLLFFDKLNLSTLSINCESIQNQDIKRNSEEYLQINIMVTCPDLEIDTRIKIGLTMAERIFEAKKLKVEDSVMVTFESPRTVTSFLIIEGKLINELKLNLINLERAKELMKKNKNTLMSPINIDERNEFDDLFSYYADIENEDFYITEIEDVSIPELKRLRAVGYIKRGKRRSHVKSAVQQIISKLKSLENRGFASHKVKYGLVEADIIYLTLYKKEVRSGRERVIQSSNENFIVQIQYDKDKNFPIRNPFIDKNLKRRQEKNIEYQWNPNF